MTRALRWLTVAVCTAVLAALPAAVGSLPARSTGSTVAQLLAAVGKSQLVAFSGYAESTGSLALPVAGQLTSLSDLLGGTNDFRVFRRGPQDWRVDQLGVAGETDTYASAAGTVTWSYESNRASFAGPSSADQVRLPVGADFLPSELGRRMLSQTTPGEVSRLPAARIAGRDAQGLRLTPSQPDSTIDHVDTWVDPGTGIALKVSIYGRGSARADLSTTFLDFSTATPPASTTRFTTPKAANVELGQQRDLTGLINRFGGPPPPQSLAGISRNSLAPSLTKIGVYGFGVTEFVVAPLPAREAGSLRSQLAKAAGVAKSDAGYSVGLGPLSLLVTDPDADGRSWLLTGSVSTALLAKAALQL